MDAGIETFFRGYADTINKRDLKQLVRHYNLPSILLTPPNLVAFNTTADVLIHLRELLESYEKNDCFQASFIVRSASFLYNFAFVTVKWSMSDRKGRIVSNFVCYYRLIRKSEEWRIAMIVNMEEKL